MNVHDTPIDGLVVLETEPFQDHRGMFARLYCREVLERVGITRPIAQINHSITREQHTLRGLHFQRAPHQECKIVRCLRGRVFDVAVDLRKGSPSLFQWHGEVLEENDGRCFVIPEGFAHGFMTLTPDAEILYLVTAAYAPLSEGGARYDDPAFGIEWPAAPALISDKDQSWPLLAADFAGL